MIGRGAGEGFDTLANGAGHEVCVLTSLGMRRFVIDSSYFSSMSERDRANQQSCSLLISSYLTLLADSPLGSNKPPLVYHKFLREFQIHGVKETIIRFTSLAHELVSSVHGRNPTSIGGFIDGFKDTPVFKEYLSFYRTGNVALVRWIYTFLSFGKKMEFVDPSFHEVAFRDWCNNEDRLTDLLLPEDTVDFIKRILSVVLPPFRFQNFWPKFGPGSVSERGVGRRKSKIENLHFDPYIDRFLFHGPIGNWGYGKEKGLSSEVLPIPSLWEPARGISSRISYLAFVPKNVKTARSICMEPNTLMFFQQGVLQQMIKSIESSVIGTFIRFDDQSFNRRLSQIGSRTGLIDTLDLSSASDCLSYDLVKKVFPPSWQIVMRATRSHSAILPGGDIRPLKKFAPMGSALCFPTQCVIFCVVCILAACLDSYERIHPSIPMTAWLTADKINECIRRFWQHTSTTSIGYQPLGIYGDDICVDSSLTDKVKSILTSLGFLVNDSKSFTGNQAFRESCGGFFLLGHDITPLYFSIKGVRGFASPEHVASQVQLINRCWERSYKNTYRFLRKSILTWGSKNTLNPIPHVSDPHDFGILCRSPVNSHLRKRYNKDYQRHEVRAWTITYTKRLRYGNLLGALERYLYMRWWASHIGDTVSRDESSSLPRYDTGSPGLRWRWIPAW